MVFCQLAQARSLREITEGLQASEGKLRHLGLPEAPSRSTLAYANEHRPWQLYESVFHQLLGEFRKRLGSRAPPKLGLPGRLISLDASVSDLTASLHNWAKFRTTKGTVKLHLMLDHDGYLPCFVVITKGKVHEIRVARGLSLEAGSMLVFDRGYQDFKWFEQLTNQGVHFVTRLNDNARLVVVERRKLQGAGVVSDEVVVLESQAGRDDAPFLRRVAYLDSTVRTDRCEVATVDRQVPLEPVALGGAATAATVRVPGSVEVARGTVCTSKSTARGALTPTGNELRGQLAA